MGHAAWKDTLEEEEENAGGMLRSWWWSVILLGFVSVSPVSADALLSSPLNVTIKEIEVNSAVVSWETLEGDPVIGFAITQQKKDVRMLRFIQEVNTTTRSCTLWGLDEDTEYIVHVQSISMSGSSPLSDPVLFRTPKETEKLASKSPGVIALFCRQYDIIKDNEPNNNKDKAKNSSECSTPEHPQGGLLRSNV
ncbi:fibronectin type III domain-containing protein 5 isoform X2 [Phyllopteryx taeniolatus]|uniref:fibronectin type III domain-containing protein 5 isoform X2 n=1 Tax=Phyllopteryx taeniolatus TaxID=161469 RepID=UPI002AD39E63|nr:fibronectin type III domain-containing protein 5 isoform X2 [Phyllopteryx taeniolatus]